MENVGIEREPYGRGVPAPQTLDASQRPANMDRIYNVTIRQTDRGYIVDAGCKTFVFETAEGLLEKLSAYLKEPAATHKLLDEGKLFQNKADVRQSKLPRPVSDLD
jgi:hypothetical protein